MYLDLIQRVCKNGTCMYCVCVSVSVWIWTYVCLWMYVCVYVCLCVNVCYYDVCFCMVYMYTCVCMCMCMCMVSYLTPERVNLKAKHLLFRQAYIMCVPTCTHAQVENTITNWVSITNFWAMSFWCLYPVSHDIEACVQYYHSCGM